MQRQRLQRAAGARDTLISKLLFQRMFEIRGGSRDEFFFRQSGERVDLATLRLAFLRIGGIEPELKIRFICRISCVLHVFCDVMKIYLLV